MSLAQRALAGLILLAFACGGSYWLGDHHRNNAWLAKQGEIVRKAHEKYEAEVERGNKAVGNYLDDLHAKELDYEALETRFKELRKSTPLVVRQVAECAAPAAAPEPATAAPGRVERPAGAQLELSLGALRLWNSALTGRDAPAGACGTDAAAPGACALGAGRTLDDAWDNHAANAKRWNEDRLRCTRLIDYLQGEGR